MAMSYRYVRRVERVEIRVLLFFGYGSYKFRDYVNFRIGVVIVVSQGYKLDEDALNIPLFMADQADRLIGMALG